MDISVVILSRNEEKHIARCIKKARLFAEEIFLVDSGSSDRTADIARSLGARVFPHNWENTHAGQFNWGLRNLPIDTEWVLRLDADEYLLPELVEELKQKIAGLPRNVSGVIFKRRHIFLGQWIKRGVYPVKLLRLFRYGKAVCEQRWMDEHIVLLEGRAVESEHDFVDHNLNHLGWWTSKHNGYAIREAVDLLDIELGLSGMRQPCPRPAGRSGKMRRIKERYARQPLFLRSFAYFIYRYVFRLGFMEGRKGFLWHFLQGWWYRTLVDANVWEIKNACGNDREKIRLYLKNNYMIEI